MRPWAVRCACFSRRVTASAVPSSIRDSQEARRAPLWLPVLNGRYVDSRESIYPPSGSGLSAGGQRLHAYIAHKLEGSTMRPPTGASNPHRHGVGEWGYVGDYPAEEVPRRRTPALQ